MRIDDQDRGKGTDAEVPDGFACRIEQDRERQRPARPGPGDDWFELFVERLEVFGLVIVEGEDLELVAVGGVIFVKVDPARQAVGDAGTAPESPEIDDDPLAPQVGELDVLVQAVRSGDVPGRKFLAVMPPDRGELQIEGAQVEVLAHFECELFPHWLIIRE